MKTHPARWAALMLGYYMISDEDKSKHGARYVGDVRVSSFNPAESLMEGWADGGIYKAVANDGIEPFIPSLATKVAEGKNPVLTTR